MDPWRPIAPVDDHDGPEIEESRSSPSTRIAEQVRRLREFVLWVGVGRLATAAVTIPLLGMGAYFLVRTPSAPVESDLAFATTTSTNPVNTEREGVAQASVGIGSTVVHVAGHVHAPGVYALDEGQRIVDAIRAAGGAQPIADLNAINLALRLSDGDQIYVPAVGEVELAPARGRVGTSTSDGETGFPVNVNSASEQQLDSLPGIGPATARAIIEHREKFGPFSSPADLLEVPGIGPSKFEAIESLVST